MGSTGRGSTGRRRAMGLGFTIVAGVLTMASVAVACTTYRGKLTVTNAQGESRSADGDDSTVHEYCTGPVSGLGVRPAPLAPPPYARAAAMSLSGTFTITVGQTTQCTGLQSQLGGDPGGDTYEVRWLDVDGLPASANCNAETDGLKLLGTIKLPAPNPVLPTTTRSGPLTAPAGSTGQINICVDLPASPTKTGIAAPEIWLNVI